MKKREKVKKDDQAAFSGRRFTTYVNKRVPKLRENVENETQLIRH